MRLVLPISGNAAGHSGKDIGQHMTAFALVTAMVVDVESISGPPCRQRANNSALRTYWKTIKDSPSDIIPLLRAGS